MSICCNRMFDAFQMYVAYVSCECCKSRSSVAYVAMTIHVHCKCMLQLFQTYVASVLSECCICCTGYTRMLQVYVSNVSVFQIYVASVLSGCCICCSVIHICCKRMF
jgi:hypothetical protein